MTETVETKAARLVRPDHADGALAEELGSPEAVVTALYAVISGPAEHELKRDWSRFRALVLPDARFMIARWPDDTGSPVDDLREWDVEGFITDATAFYERDGFWEREIWGRTERYGNVAHRFSSYESRVGSEESDPVSRGINSFQLVRYGRRWWIASIVWDIEAPDRPIPDGYLGF